MDKIIEIDFSKRSAPTGAAKFQTNYFQFVRDKQLQINIQDIKTVITKFLNSIKKGKPFWMGIEIEISWEQWKYIYIEMFSHNELCKTLFKSSTLEVIEVENKELHFVALDRFDKVAFGELKFVCVETPPKV